VTGLACRASAGAAAAADQPGGFGTNASEESLNGHVVCGKFPPFNLLAANVDGL
jgi:hypothetical protein